MRSAAAATSACAAARAATPPAPTRRRPATTRRPAASTSPTCMSRSGGCPSRSWRWSPVTPIGGGHVLQVICDLTIAADNAKFGQTGPKVGSFDGGFGASVLSRLVGPKKAKEIWFLCRQYDAQQALDMGLVNTVVPLDELEAETVKWCKEMLAALPLQPAAAQGELQRRRGRARRHPAARARRQPALLHERGGGRGPPGLPREAHARLLASSRTAPDVRSAASRDTAADASPSRSG